MYLTFKKNLKIPLIKPRSFALYILSKSCFFNTPVKKNSILKESISLFLSVSGWCLFSYYGMTYYVCLGLDKNTSKFARYSRLRG